MTHKVGHALACPPSRRNAAAPQLIPYRPATAEGAPRLPLLTFCLAVSAILLPALSAADLTGHWVASQPGRGGQPQETSIWIKASGDTFTGYMSAGRNGDIPIVDGKVTGDQITFTTVTDVYGEERRQEYTGSVTPDGLLIHPPAGGGRGAGAGPAGAPPGCRA